MTGLQTYGVGIVAVAALFVLIYGWMVYKSTRHALVSVIIIGSVFIFAAVVFGTIVLPYITFQPAPSPGMRPYTPLELVGRDIYRREGCWYCHSQFTRPQDRDFGLPSDAGDYVYDSPHLLGTERTGPDLSNIGGKFPDEWHRVHHRNPQAVQPGSLMPSFAYLDRAWASPDPDDKRFWIFDPKEGRMRRATELDALVAYLQSLGTRREKVRLTTEPEIPNEYRFQYLPKEGRYIERKAPDAIPFKLRFVKQGQGIYNEKCAPCHGPRGYGNGTNARDLVVKPANFHLPQFRNYSEAKWFWRISEGVPGTRMPPWQFTLTEEQRWYLVRWLQFLSGSYRDPKTGERVLIPPKG